MDADKSNQHLIASWDFTVMGMFPEGHDSHGCRLSEAGLELSGPGAFVLLPIDLPPDSGCLRSRSMAVCVRFIMPSEQPQSGLIAVGLDDPENARHERLVFGFQDSAYSHFRRWRVEQRGGCEATQFGFTRSAFETSANEDIHLVLSVETQTSDSRGAHFKCYRNGRPYGRHTLCSSAAEFHPKDEIALVIKRPGAPGRTMIKYAHVYGEALSDEDIQRLAHPTVEVDNQQPPPDPHQEGLIKDSTTTFDQGQVGTSLYHGEYDGGGSSQHCTQTTRHSYVVIWDGIVSDWDELRVQKLEQALLTLGAEMIVIEGFYSEDWDGRPVFVKGHFVTQKIDVMKERGLSSLQADLGPQLKRLEIGEREVDGTSLRAVLDQQLSISNQLSRFPQTISRLQVPLQPGAPNLSTGQLTLFGSSLEFVQPPPGLDLPSRDLFGSLLGILPGTYVGSSVAAQRSAEPNPTLEGLARPAPVDSEEVWRRFLPSFPALKGQEARLGIDHPDTLDSMNNLALALYAQGRHREAEYANGRALKGREVGLGLDHPDTLSSVNNLASALYKQGRHSEAEELHRRALKGREARLGMDHLDTLDSVNNLAKALNAQGRHSEAEELHRRALKGREARLGLEHPHTLRSYYNLGMDASKQGRHSAAVLYFQRALSGQEKVLGPDHPETRNTKQALENAKWAQGQHAAPRRRWILCCCGTGALLLLWRLQTFRSR